ncbi:MAG: permease-like cell division protein FtsX [Paludibacteraceae bacterium]|nr:permease-like cell division protein FtsX [Paludibacteraceae bacterium]
MKKRRFFNMYLTTTISVALVLFLIGLQCIVLLSTHTLITQIKENLALTVVMTEEADSSHVDRLTSYFERMPYCHHFDYISKEQALEEHIQLLGEDPEKFLGYNPLTDAFEVHLNAEYAQSDSIEAIRASLIDLPFVDEVLYQQNVVEVLDKGISEVSVALIVVGAILLLMSLALITNTIRLHIYSKRFLINTMRLVGATPWVIRAPFIRRNLRLGIEASALALIALAGAFYYCYARMGIMLFPITWQNIAFVVLAVILVGELIAFAASMFATDKYIRMKIDTMYEI